MPCQMGHAGVSQDGISSLIGPGFVRVYFSVQFYTKCTVLNPFVQFLKHKCAVTKLTKIALIKTVFSFTRYPCGCSRKFQKCCH
jgi:hypothetical protein